MENKDATKIVSETVQSLEKIKKKTANNVEFWLARELQYNLGYTNWVNFKNAIEKAKLACESVGTDPLHHFADVGRMMALGKGAERKVEDMALSRYACYLIAMNSDPIKTEVAVAQSYFAVQTRRQELADESVNIDSRLKLRDRVKDANKYLNSAAKEAGVQQYGLFHDAGYRGLYGGLSLREIKDKKGINPKSDLLDCIDRAELAANEFRITQTEMTLRSENIKGELKARETHKKVGTEIRNTIIKLGGTMPEKLPAVEPIKKLEKSKINQIKELKYTD
jgi:DNA-damage-inducible protein D